MYIIRCALNETLAESMKGGVVALGNFDGVHLGHQALLNQAIMWAKSIGKPALALSFDPHPRQFFDKNLHDFCLTPAKLKAQKMQTLGLDGLIILPFNQALASLTADEFIQKILIEQCGIAGLVVGYDFHFGAKRQGKPEKLQAQTAFKTRIIEPIYGDDQTLYASSTIRNHLQQGHIKAANQMLGSAYLLEGQVVDGEKIARTMGVPTANLAIRNQFMPAYGIYAAQLFGYTNKQNQPIGCALPAIVNYGVRPSQSNQKQAVFEVHIFDFDADLYGCELQVGLLDYIREERTFSSSASLQAQIIQDCELVKARLSCPP